MSSFLRSNTTIRGLGALYGGSLLSGAWTMVIPTIPVLAKHFGISAGAAAQIVTAMAVGRFVGTPSAVCSWTAWACAPWWFGAR